MARGVVTGHPELYLIIRQGSRGVARTGEAPAPRWSRDGHGTSDKETGRPTNDKFWENTDLDLSGAVLEDWDFTGCEVSTARFTRTHFHGDAWFDGAVFHDRVGFGRAVFRSSARFDETVFRNLAKFNEAVFYDITWFGKAIFYNLAWFGGVVCHGGVKFDQARVLLAPEAVRALLAPETAQVWPDGWEVREPASAEEGYLEGHEGVWGLLVPVDPVPVEDIPLTGDEEPSGAG